MTTSNAVILIVWPDNKDMILFIYPSENTTRVSPYCSKPKQPRLGEPRHVNRVNSQKASLNPNTGCSFPIGPTKGSSYLASWSHHGPWGLRQLVFLPPFTCESGVGYQVKGWIWIWGPNLMIPVLARTHCLKKWPFRPPKFSGMVCVCVSLTLSLALMSAPQWIRCSAHSWWPVRTATCSGVLNS